MTEISVRSSSDTRKALEETLRRASKAGDLALVTRVTALLATIWSAWRAGRGGRRAAPVRG